MWKWVSHLWFLWESVVPSRVIQKQVRIFLEKSNNLEFQTTSSTNSKLLRKLLYLVIAHSPFWFNFLFCRGIKTDPNIRKLWFHINIWKANNDILKLSTVRVISARPDPAICDWNFKVWETQVHCTGSWQTFGFMTMLDKEERGMTKDVEWIMFSLGNKYSVHTGLY